MSRSERASALMRPGDPLPALFVVGILLPGIVLVVFAARAMLQERRLAEQQVRERLDRAAAQASGALQAELSRWQSTIDEVAAAGALRQGAPPSLPAPVGRVLDAPEGALLLHRDGEQIAIVPDGRLPYGLADVAPPPAFRGTVPGLAEADRAERNGDHGLAIERYERLLVGATGAERAALLHRLGRTLRKAGESEQALTRYRELREARDDLVGTLPAELVALYEICSLLQELGDVDQLATTSRDLYAALVAGRWMIEKPRYLFYSQQARAWLGLDDSGSQGIDVDAVSAAGLSQDIRGLRATELRKLALGEVVEALLEDPRPVLRSGDTLGVAFWSKDPFTALILPAALAEAEIWQPVVAEVGEPGLSLRLRHDDGTLVFGQGPDTSIDSGAETGTGPAEVLHTTPPATRELRGRDFPLVVEAGPASPSGLHDELEARQALYLAMLTLAVVLLAFGGYLTVRTVQREVEVARLKSRFVSTVSHEFRSPLTGIRQLAEMLMRDRVPGEERKQSYYRMIARESSRLTRLVENVLDFSRIEEGRREYAAEVIATSGWLEQVVEEFRRELHGREVTIAAHIPAELPFLRGDREALACAVHNLLDNAVKYSGTADTVWLEVESSDSNLSVRVRDRGIGISEEDRSHLFDKFFRGGSTADEVKGVGLGLSLVQHIIAAHGGSITVDSRVGSGSTFTVELPVERGDGTAKRFSTRGAADRSPRRPDDIEGHAGPA